MNRYSMPGAWPESSDLPIGSKTDGPPTTVRVKKSSSKTTGSTTNTVKRTVTSRFSKAFKRALSNRSRHLGRRLTRPEWVALRTAVKKQCERPRATSIEVRLDALVSLVARLERDVGYRFSPSKQMCDLEGRLLMLRQSLMDAIEENDGLSETCGHIRHKKVVHLSSPVSVSTEIKGLKIEALLSKGVHRLSCQSCTRKREDFVFLRVGEIPTFGTSPNSNTLVHTLCGKESSELASCIQAGFTPLSFQSVWSTSIDELLGREKASSGTKLAS